MRISLTFNVTLENISQFTDLEVIKYWLKNNLSGTTHESFDDNEEKLGEISVEDEILLEIKE